MTRRLTPAEQRALDAVWIHGGVKEAAHALRVSRSTVEKQLASARSRLDVATTIDALRATRNSGSPQ